MGACTPGSQISLPKGDNCQDAAGPSGVPTEGSDLLGARPGAGLEKVAGSGDRKSTRLNSSH